VPGRVTPRPWFWPLAAGGHGPDWYFHATFADPAGLARRVAEHLSTAFVRDVGVADPDQLAYLDAHTHTRLTEMRAAGVRENIYVFAEVTVTGGALMMCHGLAGDRFDETPMLRALLAAPELGLTDWQVGYGGDFTGQVAQGVGAESLRLHLGLASA
jgi:hypothetical protein